MKNESNAWVLYVCATGIVALVIFTYDSTVAQAIENDLNESEAIAKYGSNWRVSWGYKRRHGLLPISIKKPLIA